MRNQLYLHCEKRLFIHILRNVPNLIDMEIKQEG